MTDDPQAIAAPIVRWIVWHPEKAPAFLGPTASRAWVYAIAGRGQWAIDTEGWRCTRIEEPAHDRA